MSDAAKPDRPEQTLVLEFEFDAPPSRVWRAVTIQALRERWLPDADLAVAEPQSSVTGEEVSYRMRDTEPPFRESDVTFRLEPNEAGGTRLRITHQARGIGTQPPKPANSNCCLMLAA